ncbi:hypothetical protein BST61_g8736 [Cercospora zeina]
MFRAPLHRLQQTANHLIRSASPATTTTATATLLTSRPFSATALRRQDADAMADRPNGAVANSGLELLTFGTPNGHKASIILEELKDVYGKPEYVSQSIHIGQNIQKEPWFTQYGPNGRIPVLIDHDNGDLGIMEGSAILSYVTRHFDPEHKLSFTKDPELSECEQWVAWQHGGLGPMQGQANHFYRLAKERIPYPTQRYVGETERLYGVLDIRLKGREYLVGDKYSIADIANFSWVNVAYFAGVQLDSFPNLYKWWERINARPAVKRGLAVPSEPSITNEAYKRRLQEEDGFKDKEDELKGHLQKAQEQYEYKFSAP